MANAQRHKLQGNPGGQDHEIGFIGSSSTRLPLPYQVHRSPSLLTTTIEASPCAFRNPAVATVSCQGCADVHQIVNQIAHELGKLLGEIRGAMSGEQLRHYTILEAEGQRYSLDPVNDDLGRFIGWILESIKSTTQFMNLLRLNHSQRSTQPFQFRDSTTKSHSAITLGTKRKSRGESDGEGDVALPSLYHQIEHPPREGSFGLYLSDEDRTSKASDESPPLTSHLSSSSSGNMFVPSQPQLPVPSNVHPLHLPTAKIPNSFMLPPISPSLTGPVTHLPPPQDLRQLLDTKTLAFENLQREYQHLVSAFSRSQSRIACLDQSCSASIAEINDLADGRIRLEAYIETLEAKVRALQRLRDDIHTQSINEGAQYMKIMAMSSKLEAQCASDSLKFKAERERWALEKRSFTKRIGDLENEKQKLLHTIHGDKPNEASIQAAQSAATTNTAESIDVQTSQLMLREEVRCLRTQCNDFQAALQGLRQESTDFTQAFAKLGAAGQRLEEHFQTLPKKFALQETVDNPSVPVGYWRALAEG